MKAWIARKIAVNREPHLPKPWAIVKMGVSGVQAEIRELSAVNYAIFLVSSYYSVVQLGCLHTTTINSTN